MPDDIKTPTALDAELEKFAGPAKFDFGQGREDDQQQTNNDKGSGDDTQQDDKGEQQNRLENPKISLDDFAKDLGNSRTDILKTLDDKKEDDDDKSKEIKTDDSKLQQDKDSKDNKKLEDKKEDKQDDKSKQLDDKSKGDDGFKNQRQSTERDLTGFSDQVSVWLKRMPLDAYQFFAKQLREKAEYTKSTAETIKSYETKIKTLEEGKQVLPDSYYENPESVILTQDFKELQADLNLAQQVEQHWENQILNISSLKEGESVDVILVKANEKGELYLDDRNPIKVDDSNKVQVLHTLNKYARDCAAQTNNVRGQLSSVVTNYQSRHKEYVSKLAQAEDKYMPWFKDEKNEEYKYFKSVAEQLPAQGISKANPLFNMLAKSIAMNLLLKEALANFGKAGNKEQQKQNLQKKAGPTGDDFTGGSGSSGGPRINNLKQFEGLPPIKI